MGNPADPDARTFLADVQREITARQKAWGKALEYAAAAGMDRSALPADDRQTWARRAHDYTAIFSEGGSATTAYDAAVRATVCLFLALSADGISR